MKSARNPYTAIPALTHGVDNRRVCSLSQLRIGEQGEGEGVQLSAAHVLGNLGVVQGAGGGDHVVNSRVQKPRTREGGTTGSAEAARDC